MLSIPLPLASQGPTSSTSPAPSKPSGRKGNKKVRTGCITCKIRKVKCDEAKPFCQRCVKTGRKCDGYREVSRRSTPESSLSPVPGLGSDRESRAYDYFRMRSAKALSGTIDASFWGDLVLKLSATEPGVRHAVLAVSSLHEYVEVKSRSGQELDRRFAFQEYGNAIRSLRNWAERDEPSAVPLLVCILFICIEFLANRTTASQMHIIQGRKILSGLADGHSPSMDLIKRHLVPIYTRLSLSSVLFGNRPAVIPAHLKSWVEVPAVYTSMEEARRGLYQILDEGLDFSSRATTAVFDPSAEIERQHLRRERQELLSKLARWNSAFTVLMTMSPHSTTSSNDQNLIRIYYHAGIIWISKALEASEFAYDAHLSDFSTIISLASSVINNVPNGSKMGAFGFETEIIAPVYWVAIKCRHPLLRRAAVKLLARDQIQDRRENLWSAKDAVTVAVRVIELEEAGLSYSDFGGSPGDSPLSDGDSYSVTSELVSSEFKVQVTEPPTLPAPKPCFTDPMEEITDNENTPVSSPNSTDSTPSSIATAIDAMQQLDLNSVKARGLEPPFGVPQSQRIINTVIGCPEPGGVSATHFRLPEPGQTEWNIVKEFLRY